MMNLLYNSFLKSNNEFRPLIHTKQVNKSYKLKRLCGLKAFLLPSAMLIWLSSFSQSLSFTANGTWTAPAGLTSITVECWGGGGGGGGGGTVNLAAGGGGGGGGYARSVVTVVPGNTYTVTVGAAGTAGAAAGTS